MWEWPPLLPVPWETVVRRAFKTETATLNRCGHVSKKAFCLDVTPTMKSRNLHQEASPAPAEDRTPHLVMGDLATMSRLMGIIRAAGIEVGQTNIYPTVYGAENWKKALTVIHGMAGAEQFRSEVIALGLCTAEEWAATYRRQNPASGL